MSDALTTRVIIYFINAIDSLGNHIYIFIDYNPLVRYIVAKCKLDFEMYLHHILTDYLYPTFCRIKL